MNDSKWNSQRTQPNDYMKKKKQKAFLGFFPLHHQSHLYLYEISNYIFYYIFTTSSLGPM